MSPWEDAALASLFPTADALPERVRVKPEAHRPRWLADGEIHEAQGSARPVTSRLATRSTAGLAPTLLGHEAMLTVEQAQAAVAAATRAWKRGEGEWPAASFSQRTRAVERFAKAVEAKTDDIATLLM